MWYWIFRAGFTCIFKLLFKFKMEGRENLPQKTNFIVASNHTSFLDAVAIGVTIPKKIYWVASRYLYQIPWVKWILRRMDCFPAGSSSQGIINLLRENKNVGLFPEGKCGRDGKLKKFRRGVALLALKTGRPIVPCAILGSFKILPWGAKFPKLFLPITIKIDKPIFLLKEFDNVIDDARLQEGIFRIHNAIQGMINAG